MWKQMVPFLSIAALTSGCQIPEGPDQIASGSQNMMSAQQAPDAGAGDANDTPAASAAPAPAAWQEHWFEHVQLLQKIAETEDDVIYFDKDVAASSLGWIQPLVQGLWKYTKKTYGVPGDPRLFAIFHSGRYSGEHAASLFDATHDFRNVIDLGGEVDLWVAPTPTNASHIAYSAGQVLEKTPFGVDTLPSVPLTGFEFSYFFAYDALKAVGMGAAADAWFGVLMARSIDSPRVGTFWTRDWYYPLWRDYGGAAVFARFIQLVADRYPKVPRDGGTGKKFAPTMNWGEYFHFMSGAAGVDLKTLATKAFGWPDGRDTELQQAKIAFPAITYAPPK